MRGSENFLKGVSVMTTSRASERIREAWLHRCAKLHVLAGLLTLCLLAAHTASAQNIDPDRFAAADKAHRFLVTKERGREILSYVHFGVDYTSHRYQKYVALENGNFALVYEYKWKSTENGVTDVAFSCDSDGNIYEVSIVYTDAVLNQPFLMANLSIKVLGNLLLENYADKMSKEDRRLAQQLVDNPNAKRLLELSLRIEQAFGT